MAVSELRTTAARTWVMAFERFARLNKKQQSDTGLNVGRDISIWFDIQQFACGFKDPDLAM